jgi:hypothetical protein
MGGGLGLLGTVFGGQFGGLFGGGLFGRLLGGLFKIFLSQAFAPSQGGGGGGGEQKFNRTLTIKEPVGTRRIVYGRVQASGHLIFSDTSADTTADLHMVVAIADHEIQTVEKFVLDGDLINLNHANRVHSSGDGIHTCSSDGLTLTMYTAKTPLYEAIAVGDKIKVAGNPATEDSVQGTTRIVSAKDKANRTLTMDTALPTHHRGNPGTIQEHVILKAGETAANNLLSTGTVTYDGETASVVIDGDGKRTVTLGSTSYNVEEQRTFSGGTVTIQWYIKVEGDTKVFVSNATTTAGTSTDTGYEEVIEVGGREFGDKARLEYALGTDPQLARQSLTAEVRQWTSNHTGNGVAYLYGRFSADNDVFPNGAPNLGAIVQGKKLYDPRTSTTYWNSNAALVLRDYLTNTRYGAKIPEADLNEASFIAAANLCDESVVKADGTTEPRYAVHTVLDTKDAMIDNITHILNAMDGTLAYAGGQWYIFPGENKTPILTLTDDHIIGKFKISNRVPFRDRFNTIKGTYIAEENSWQESDFPSVVDAAAKADDNDIELIEDIELKAVASPSQAQRLAKIRLNKMRQEIMVEGEFDLAAYPLFIGDTFYLTHEDAGWTQKLFVVQEWQLAALDDDDQDTTAPTLGVKLVAREWASNIYDFDPTTDETEVDPNPNTSLPKIGSIQAPTGLALSSGTDDLLNLGDGTVISRIKATWDIAGSGFITNGGQVEVQVRESGQITWQPAGRFSGDRSSVHLTNVRDGVNHDVRIRFIDSVGIKSTWSGVFDHYVVGKTAKPGNVQNVNVQQNGVFITLSWDKVTDLDLSGYRIKRGPTWEDAQIIANVHKTEVFHRAFGPDTHKLLIKAVDTTGNESDIPAVATFTVTNTQTPNTEFKHTDAAHFQGTLVNFTQHHTGDLIPETDDLITDEGDTGDESFGWGNRTFEEECTAEFQEIDLGSDTAVWAFGTLDSALMPGTSGDVNPRLQIKYRLDGEPASGDASTVNLITERGTPVDMILHHTNTLIPANTRAAQSASATTFPLDDVIGVGSFETEEIDLGSNIVVNIDADVVTELFRPATTGTPNVTVLFDSKTSAGAYSGFQQFDAGQINARYVKFKLVANASTGQTTIKSAVAEISNYRSWNTPGEITARYVQFRIKVLTAEAPAQITGYHVGVRDL